MIQVGPSSFAQEFDWKTLGVIIYTKALVYSLQMTSELISNMKFHNGGTQKQWPYGGDYIIYRQQDAVFLPAVMPPLPTAPKTAPTMLSASRVRVYTTVGGTLVWRLPAHWAGMPINCTTLTEEGPVPGPKLAVHGRNLTMIGVPAFSPVILQV